MVNSSFQTENCWMYLGRHPMSHDPYLWRLSALDWYLSAGLTKAAFRTPWASRGKFRGLEPSGMLTRLRLVVERHLIAGADDDDDGFTERMAEARALLLQSLLAIFVGFAGDGLNGMDEAGKRRQLDHGTTTGSQQPRQWKKDGVARRGELQTLDSKLVQ